MSYSTGYIKSPSSQKGILGIVEKYFQTLDRCEEPFMGNPSGMTKDVAGEILISDLDGIYEKWKADQCREF